MIIIKIIEMTIMMIMTTLIITTNRHSQNHGHDDDHVVDEHTCLLLVHALDVGLLVLQF
jgi:hypothetical protein